MLKNQLSVELKRAYSEKNLFIWLSIIFFSSNHIIFFNDTWVHIS